MANKEAALSDSLLRSFEWQDRNAEIKIGISTEDFRLIDQTLILIDSMPYILILL